MISAKQALLEGLPVDYGGELRQCILASTRMYHKWLSVLRIGCSYRLEHAITWQLNRSTLYSLKRGQAAKHPLLKGRTGPAHNGGSPMLERVGKMLSAALPPPDTICRG